MTKKIGPGFAGRKQKEYDARRKAEIAKRFAELIENAEDDESRIAVVTQFFDEFVAKDGAKALRWERDWLIRQYLELEQYAREVQRTTETLIQEYQTARESIKADTIKVQDEIKSLIKAVSEQIVAPPKYEDDDSYMEQVTLVSYKVVLKRPDGSGYLLSEDNVKYPAPIETALNEVSSQILYITGGLPTNDDLKNAHVNGVNDADLLRVLAYLWRWQRIDPEEYETQHKIVFDDLWSTNIRADVIQQIRNTHGDLGRAPTQAEISHLREKRYDQYRQTVKAVLQRTRKRLEKIHLDETISKLEGNSPVHES